MKMKKIGCLLILLLLILLIISGCNNEVEESNSLAEDLESVEGTEDEAETSKEDEPMKMEHDEDAESDEPKDPDLTGMKAAFLIAPGFHSGETVDPLAHLEAHGVECILIGPETGDVKAYNTNLSLTIEVAIDEVDSSDYDLLIIPGGHSPMELKGHNGAIKLVQEFMEAEKVVATICRGPYLLAGADVLKDRTLTSIDYIDNAIVNAGGVYVNEAVVVDDNLITSRRPGDIPLFNQAIVEALAPKE